MVTPKLGILTKLFIWALPTRERRGPVCAHVRAGRARTGPGKGSGRSWAQGPG